METPGFASSARFSAELMESTSTDAAATAEAATTEGAAGSWLSATAAAAAASAASRYTIKLISVTVFSGFSAPLLKFRG